MSSTPPTPPAGAERVAQLGAVPLFRGLSDDVLAAVAAIATAVNYAAGEVVCKRGDDGDCLYLVTAGTVHVRRGERLLAELGAGEVVGELSVLDRQPRSADVVAASALELVRIRAADFDRAVDRHPQLGRALLEVLAGRLRDAGSMQVRVDQLVRAYRERGHVLAGLDPLGFTAPGEHPELSLEHHGLSDDDLDTRCFVLLGREPSRMPLGQILARLRQTYCAATGVQYMHIDDLRVQRWLRERLEDPAHERAFGRDEQLRILRKLTDADVFETFLQRTYSRAQRFSLEGAETLIPLLDQAIEKAGEAGVERIVMGMAHRGRLNVLANVLAKPPARIFAEFEDAATAGPAGAGGAGDIKYHQGYAADRMTACGRPVHLELAFNPSHLEFVSPVVLGRARHCRNGSATVVRAAAAAAPGSSRSSSTATPRSPARASSRSCST